MRSGFLSLRPGLRSKILLATALIPAVLASAVLLTVHRNVRAHVETTSIHENLEHSASVLESMLGVRLRALSGGARVIASDPRFFSLVMLGPAQRDRHFVATMQGSANDFNRITQTDVFEVFDRHGRPLASVGSAATTKDARESIVREALAGREVARVMVQGGHHYQVAAVPVRGDGRIVGVLMLGAVIGQDLARELKSQMRSEVTFFSNGRITGTTLQDSKELEALKRHIAGIESSPGRRHKPDVEKVSASQETYLTLIRPVPGFDDMSQLYVMQRSNDAESEFLQQMQKDMFVLGGIAVLIALIAGWLFSGQITRPVLALVEGARAMERGDFDARIAVKNRDEIGYLAERFQVMRERERAYVESLREAARVKSEFISVASHELRTPISVIQGYRDLLSNGSLGELSRPQAQAIGAIGDCLTQLTRVAENATRIAQLEGERLALAPARIEMRPLIERAVAMAQAAATGRQVAVTCDLSTSLGSAWIDAARLTETMTHLIGNGIRFTPDGGEVRVAAYGDPDTIAIEVRDTGVGMKPDRLDQLFGQGLLLRESKHHHSSNAFEFNSAGLGFGLAIARAIVEAHGGTIDAVSEEGSGTAITVRLRRAPLDEQSAAA